MTESRGTTLFERAEAAACGGGRVTFVGSTTDGSDPQSVSWSQLLEEGRAIAGRIQARGVAPGDHVALLGPTTRPLVTAALATWLAGAATVMLPLPMRLASVEEFVSQTRERLGRADVRLIGLDPALAEFIDQRDDDPPRVLLDELAASSVTAGPGAYEAPLADPRSLAILQFTSGSTSQPKGVMLPHAQVLANVDAIVERISFGRDDVCVSWLPLYHDMGLIGLLVVPMCTGADLVLAAPQDFTGAPARWMEWMSAYGGTCTAGPNFAYALAARALDRQSQLDLSSWRLGLNGAEPIDPAAVDAFCGAGARHGLDPGSVFCAFGMAEATLAVTFPALGGGLVSDWVDRRALEHELAAVPLHPGDPRARRLARLGTAVPGMEIQVVEAESGLRVPDREVGELEIRGSSLTPGYYGQPEATADAFRDGWLRTGDLAYLSGGELVVCGRSKDMIIVGGRNVFPEDVERAVGTVAGVRQGNVVAFGVQGRRGRERMVVVAETREDDPATVRRAVAARVRDVLGMGLDDVVLVGASSLPKTSSGKLQRSLCRSRYLDSQLELV